MSMEKIDEINISALPIASKVSRHAQASLFASMLDALQEESSRLGYRFVMFDYGGYLYLKPDVRQCIARAVLLRRNHFLYPRRSRAERQEVVDRQMRDGYGETMLDVLLNALEALGVRIKEGPGADALAGIAKGREIELEARVRDAGKMADLRSAYPFAEDDET